MKKICLALCDDEGDDSRKKQTESRFTPRDSWTPPKGLQNFTKKPLNVWTSSVPAKDSHSLEGNKCKLGGPCTASHTEFFKNSINTNPVLNCYNLHFAS